MLLRENLIAGHKEWEATIHSLDQRIAAAYDHYESANAAFSAEQLADAFNDVLRLSLAPSAGGGSPDYAKPAIPLAYALHYQMTTTAFNAWLLYQLNQQHLLRPLQMVLDVGSGIDAVSLAIEATGAAGASHRIVCFEPSMSMRNFAQAITCTLNREHYAGVIDTVFALDSSCDQFDAIFFSYVFPYEYSRRSARQFARLAHKLVQVLAPGGMIVYCGPPAKRQIRAKFKEALEDTGCIETTDVLPGYARHLSRNYFMPQLNERLLSQIAQIDQFLTFSSFRQLHVGQAARAVATWPRQPPLWFVARKRA